MPRKGFTTISFHESVCDKMGLSAKKVSYLLEQRLEESKKLRKIAEKITKVPESVRVYTVPTMERES